MKAQMKSGHIITGKLAEVFNKIGIATLIEESESKAKLDTPVKRNVSEKSRQNLKPRKKKV
jgi:hypothetical protein